MKMNQRVSKDVANLQITKIKIYTSDLFCTEVQEKELMCVQVQLLFS